MDKVKAWRLSSMVKETWVLSKWNVCIKWNRYGEIEPATIKRHLGYYLTLAWRQDEQKFNKITKLLQPSLDLLMV